MSRARIKKRHATGTCLRVTFEPASEEDLKRYPRDMRRKAKQHLLQNGLKVKSSNDKRVIQLLDRFNEKEQEALKKKIEEATHGKEKGNRQEQAQEAEHRETSFE
jgi:hypothetical protein